MPKKRSKSKRQEALWGYFFVAPFLLGFVVFMLGPMLFSFVGSFTDYNLTSKMNFIGFKNFTRMFTQDTLFWKSLYNTAYFVLFNVPLTTLFSVFLATLLNQKSAESVFSEPPFTCQRSFQGLPSTSYGCNYYLLPQD